LGSVAKHKNYKWIYEVAARNNNIQFVVAGNISKKAWGIDNSAFELENIIFTGYVTDEENKALINSCWAFLQPSKYEGFGIPPLEAIALGKKALVSNVTCLPEIYEGYAPMFAPDDYDVNIEELLAQDTNPSEPLIEKYTWKKVAQSWLKLFDN
jgi:glycosyltransferase involved in cell wall biosynthesis